MLTTSSTETNTAFFVPMALEIHTVEDILHFFDAAVEFLRSLLVADLGQRVREHGGSLSVEGVMLGLRQEMLTLLD